MYHFARGFNMCEYLNAFAKSMLMDGEINEFYSKSHSNFRIKKCGKITEFGAGEKKRGNHLKNGQFKSRSVSKLQRCTFNSIIFVYPTRIEKADFQMNKTGKHFEGAMIQMLVATKNVDFLVH
jgi:hypothetical protein